MPMNRELYPDNWDEIARGIKDAAGWKCQNCQKQCRFPGEPLDTHQRTATVAHINHVESDCRPENLVCLCAPCHLAYDRHRKQLQHLAKKRIERERQETLFGDSSCGD